MKGSYSSQVWVFRSSFVPFLWEMAIKRHYGGRVASSTFKRAAGIVAHEEKDPGDIQQDGMVVQ